MKPFALLLVGVIVGWAASGVDWSREAIAQEKNVDTFSDQESRERRFVAPVTGRYEISAYGSPSGHGCYRVDTVTGNVWHIANGQPPKPVADDPLGFKANTGPTRISGELRTYPYDPARTAPPEIPVDDAN
jgi:hypothetical protein